MRRYLPLFVAGVVSCWSPLVKAEVNPQFLRTDNLIALNLAYTDPGGYATGWLGLHLSGLSARGWWGELAVDGLSSLQMWQAPSPGRVASGWSGQARTGYATSWQQLNLIAYIGGGINDNTNFFHEDSMGLYDYNLTNFTFMLGVKPEYLILANLKFSLDLSFNFQKQVEIIPQANDLSHNQLNNYYGQITPALQWLPLANLSIEAYWQQPWLISHNQALISCTNCGENSSTVISSLSFPAPLMGIKLGWLF